MNKKIMLHALLLPACLIQLYNFKEDIGVVSDIIINNPSMAKTQK